MHQSTRFADQLTSALPRLSTRIQVTRLESSIPDLRLDMFTLAATQHITTRTGRHDPDTNHGPSQFMAQDHQHHHLRPVPLLVAHLLAVLDHTGAKEVLVEIDVVGLVVPRSALTLITKVMRTSAIKQTQSIRATAEDPLPAAIPHTTAAMTISISKLLEVGD